MRLLLIYLLVITPAFVKSQDFFIGAKLDAGYGGIKSQQGIDQYFSLSQKKDTAIQDYEYFVNNGFTFAFGVASRYEFNDMLSLNAEVHFHYLHFEIGIIHNYVKNAATVKLINTSDFVLTSVVLPVYGQITYYNIYILGGLFATYPLKYTINSTFSENDMNTKSVTAELDGLNAGNIGLTAGVGIITHFENSRLLWGVRVNYGFNGYLYTSDETYDAAINDKVDLFSERVQDDLKGSNWGIVLNDFQKNNFILSLTYLF